MTARYPTGEALLEWAAAETGLDDFGPGDFRPGLDVLLASLEADAGLAPSTDEAVIGALRTRLVNRLEVESWYEQHAEIDEVAVDGPVDVIGLPRTGTSALGSMLSLDPRFRCLRMWEQRQPCPPPTPDDATDPRRLAYAAETAQLPAALRAMHLYEPDATVEDMELLGMAFHAQQYTLPVYGYHAWWREADCTETFAYHRRVVKLLGSRRPPRRWLFKAPHHTFHVEAMVAAYPGARFLMTHRDPAKAVTSYASFVSNLFPAAAGEHDLIRLGGEVSGHMRVGLERAIAARARVGEERFFDVHHVDLLADPLGTIERIYRFLDLDLPGPVMDSIRHWQATNRAGAHGEHRYTPEQFGLRADQLRADYDFYIDRFDIAVEDRP